jgi:hypothetical protein
MRRRLVFVIASGLTLTGCCLGSGCYAPPSSVLTSWNGRSPVSKRKNVEHVKAHVKARKTSETATAQVDPPNEVELAALKLYSTEWWSVRDAIDRAAEAKLAKKLIICRGCMPMQRDDQTGSIAPKSALVKIR